MNITGHREHKHVTPDESTEKHELKHLKLNTTNNHEVGGAAEQRKITSTPEPPSDTAGVEEEKDGMFVELKQETSTSIVTNVSENISNKNTSSTEEVDNDNDNELNLQSCELNNEDKPINIELELTCDKVEQSFVNDKKESEGMQKSQAPKEKDHKKKKNLTSAVTKEEKRRRNNSGIKEEKRRRNN